MFSITNSSGWNGLLVLVLLSPLTIWLFSALQFRYRRGGHPTPPGPTGLPLGGNIWALLRVQKQRETFGQYKRKFGDIVHLHGLGNHCVILNSTKVIDDLLCKRSNQYSQRPVLTVVGELMGLDQCTVFRQNDAEWRLHRRFAHSVLSPVAVQQYHHVQEDLARRLCLSMLSQPEKFSEAVKLFAGRIIFRITYGLSVEATDNIYFKHAEVTIALISRSSVPGKYLCDFLPLMKYLPSWMPFQKEAATGKQMIQQLITRPFEHVRRDISNGTAPPSLMRSLLQMDSNGIPNFENTIKWTVGTMYGAGAEATHATLLVFILVMALNPNAQACAKKELDKVIGSQSLPTIADKDRLPYLNAVIKETMRWCPITPLGPIRRVDDDDIYNGFFIPRGATVLPNLWALAFEDNDKYDPQEFIPERFLDQTQDIPDPATWAFGFGKRICPGKALAENSLFIAVASILWACKISPPDSGSLNPRFVHKLVCLPEPYDCKIEPTSEERFSLLQQAVSS